MDNPESTNDQALWGILKPPNRLATACPCSPQHSDTNEKNKGCERHNDWKKIVRMQLHDQ